MEQVIVSGLGVVSPAGSSVDDLWDQVVKGLSCARHLDALEGEKVTFGCAATFDAGQLGGKEARRLDRFAQMALLAGRAAVADADLDGGGPCGGAVVVGTGIGGILSLIDAGERFLTGQPTSPLLIPTIMANAAGAKLAMDLGWTGPNLTISTACASGAHAIGEAARLVASGSVSIALAGGVEAPIARLPVRAFADLGALSTRNDCPSRASRPFDQARDGFVIGEGAAFVVLESAASAEARGARMLARVRGYAANCDAHHVVMPEPSGAGAAACMQAALESAGLTSGDVGHVSAHGTSTPQNDAAEAAAIRRVFGERSAEVPVTAVKGSLGHMLGAAGAMQVIVAAKSLAVGLIPPIANLSDPGFADLDLVHSVPRTARAGPVVVNSFAFGGHNASLVIDLPPHD